MITKKIEITIQTNIVGDDNIWDPEYELDSGEKDEINKAILAAETELNKNSRFRYHFEKTIIKLKKHGNKRKN